MALSLTYRDATGQVSSCMLFRHNEPSLSIQGNDLPWSFDADASPFRLASEAYRIKLAHLFDPHLAVHTSRIEPLPHQITAVYQEMLPKQPLRFLLADDPGAGKTIMTGLLIKELMLRGDVKRCLVVCPGSLAEQWQDELYNKFQLEFALLSRGRFEESVTGNAFNDAPLAIARLDMLSRNEDLQEKLAMTDWDLIVVDEAHKMSASQFGFKAKYTKRYLLGKLLSRITRHYLLLTATPHNGKEEEFQLFLGLLDPDRFEGVERHRDQSANTTGLMRRLIKEELLTFDGKRLFPERQAFTAGYQLEALEQQLYDDVTAYVQQEFNRAEKLLNPERQGNISFALTILQRRLASSPEAIYQSLRRRRERLESQLADLRLQQRGSVDFRTYSDEELADLYDAPEEEISQIEQEIVDRATAATTIEELLAEIFTLKVLEAQALEVRNRGADSKWKELARVLQDEPVMRNPDGSRKKLIIFTEHRDTLHYLTQQIRAMLGDPAHVVTIQGGMRREQRRSVENSFKNERDVTVLVATDAAGEGINLQCSHLMINYDLPWNPNRIEQRFGRIHRIGQQEVCTLWNLIALGTREGEVFDRLFTKLNTARESLGGRVFDVLGKVSFGDQSLKDLLVQAIRYGNDPAVRRRLHQVVDDTLDRGYLERLLQEHALAPDHMGLQQVMNIREEMERIEARRLQPHFIEQFFLEAFTRAGGAIRRQSGQRYTISRVPRSLMGTDKRGAPRLIANDYEHVTFSRDEVSRLGQRDAELICPGHPLLETAIDWVLDNCQALLKRGAILIDDDNQSHAERLLFYIENTICDARVDTNGQQRKASQQMHFVEIDKETNAISAGFSPYLAYRPPTEVERPLVKAIVEQSGWLQRDVESLAIDHAIQHLLAPHIEEVQQERNAYVYKVQHAVQKRLRSEISYWDQQNVKYREQARAGKANANLNADNASKRVDELSRRLEKRQAELELERQLLPQPPLVIGGALVIPASMLQSDLPQDSEPILFGQERKEIELKAMQAVRNIERKLGNIPKDVSAAKCGYDIESIAINPKQPDQRHLRFIEVKGRRIDQKTVTVTRNEILVAQNTPERFILAIVMVAGDVTHTTYLRRPFQYQPDLAVASVNYYIDDLKAQAEVTYEERQ